MPDLLEDELIKAEMQVCIGEDDKTHATRLSDVLAASLLDIDISAPGKVAIRDGQTLQGTQTGSLPIRGLIGMNHLTNGKKLVEVTGQDIKVFTGSGSWTSVFSTLTSDQQAYMVNLLGATNKIVVLNGVDSPVEYDGSTATQLTNTNADPPKGDIGLFSSNGRFLVSSAASFVGGGNIITYSTTNPTTLQGAFDRAANQIKVQVPKITGMIEWTQGEVLVFGQDAIYILDIHDATPSNWTLRALATDIGCIAPRSVVMYSGSVLFWSRDGVRSVSQGATNLKRTDELPLTDPLKTDYIELLQLTQTSRICAFPFNGRVLFSIPIGVNSLNRILVFDRRVAPIDQAQRGGWTVWRIAAESFAAIDFSGSEALYMGASGLSSQVYKYSGTSDNGVAIEYQYTTKRYDYTVPGVDKTGNFLEVEVLAGGTGLLVIEVNLDNAGFTTAGTMLLTGAAPTLPQMLPFNLAGDSLLRQKFSMTHFGRFRDIQFRFTMGTLDQTMTMNRFTNWAFQENLELA